jgi:hypothetical protein
MNTSKLVFGLLLLFAGVAGFLDAIDVWEMGNLWSWWPLGLIAIGLVNEISALSQRRSDGGIWLIAIGVWLLISTHHFFGLNHRTAFPVGIAVFGLGMLLHAIVDRPRQKKSEEQEQIHGNS